VSDIRIDEIRRQLEEIATRSKMATEVQPQGASFASVLGQAINQVNQDVMAGEKAVQNYVSGREASLHSTMIALEKADISFRLMMQVRNKLTDAYNEIMRTSV
jgi:flagellar hook-basal body complex protein FliE